MDNSGKLEWGSPKSHGTLSDIANGHQISTQSAQRHAGEKERLQCAEHGSLGEVRLQRCIVDNLTITLRIWSLSVHGKQGNIAIIFWKKKDDFFSGEKWRQSIRGDRSIKRFLFWICILYSMTNLVSGPVWKGQRRMVYVTIEIEVIQQMEGCWGFLAAAEVRRESWHRSTNQYQQISPPFSSAVCATNTASEPNLKDEETMSFI